MKKDEWIRRLKNWGERKDRLLIAFLFGVLLLVIAIPVERGRKGAETGADEGWREGEDSGSGENITEQEYAARMERQLEEVLAQMKGAGDVTVMITLKESAEKIVEKDVEGTDESVSEEDSQGGMRETKNSSRGESTVYCGEASGSFGGSGGGQKGQAPYVSKEVAPRVEGVVVVAEGGDDAVAVQNITESVQALFGIDTHKIRIVKKE